VQAAGRGSISSRQRVHVGAFELGELAVFEHLAHDFVIGGQVSSTSAAVEMVLPLPYFTGAGRFRSSKSTRPSCCGELMLNGLPASV
jgi:hypothetical protein